MITHLKITKNTQATEALGLPKGRLIAGELLVDFSPESVISAARQIRLHAEVEFEEETFTTQAGILEYAANQLGWNSSPKYKTI